MLSTTTIKRNQSAKNVYNTAKNVKKQIAFKNGPSDYSEREKPNRKVSKQKSDSKNLNKRFDSICDLEQSTEKPGEEQLFLSLESHNGKLPSFSDKDQKHGNLGHLTDQYKFIIQ